MIGNYFLKHSLLYVYGVGTVEFEKLFVQAKAPCEVVKYLVKDKQGVKVGTPLARIKYISSSKKAADMSALKTEISFLKKQAEQKEIALKESVLFRSIRKEKAADNTTLSKERQYYYQAKNDLNNLNLKIASLEVEYNRESNSGMYGDNGELSGDSSIVTVLSKFDALIFRLSKRIYEYVKEGENLIVLENPEKMMVYARYKSEYYGEIEENAPVFIELPDGHNIEGVVFNIYTKSYYTGDKAQTSKENLILEILPISSDKIKQWKKFKGTDVTVKIPRKNSWIWKYYDKLSGLL